MIRANIIISCCVLQNRIERDSLVYIFHHHQVHPRSVVFFLIIQDESCLLFCKRESKNIFEDRFTFAAFRSAVIVANVSLLHHLANWGRKRITTSSFRLVGATRRHFQYRWDTQYWIYLSQHVYERGLQLPSINVLVFQNIFCPSIKRGSPLLDLRGTSTSTLFNINFKEDFSTDGRRTN